MFTHTCTVPLPWGGGQSLMQVNRPTWWPGYLWKHVWRWLTAVCPWHATAVASTSWNTNVARQITYSQQHIFPANFSNTYTRTWQASTVCYNNTVTCTVYKPLDTRVLLHTWGNHHKTCHAVLAGLITVSHPQAKFAPSVLDKWATFQLEEECQEAGNVWREGGLHTTRGLAQPEQTLSTESLMYGGLSAFLSFHPPTRPCVKTWPQNATRKKKVYIKNGCSTCAHMFSWSSKRWTVPSPVGVNEEADETWL